MLVGARWLVWSAVVGNLLVRSGGPSWVPHTSWWLVLAGWILLISPWGRMALTVVVARTLLRGVRSGRYPRGGSMHLRLWTAEAAADALGAGNLAGAPWISVYARALGAKVGRGVQLQAVPPVTGLLNLGKRSSVEPEVDLSGHWLDGDVLHIGRIRVGAGASVGSRSVLLPGARVGQDAEVAPGSVIDGSVPPGELWAGSPAFRVAMAHRDWPRDRPAPARRWVTIYAVHRDGAGAACRSSPWRLDLRCSGRRLRESSSAADAAASSLLYLLPATAVGLLRPGTAHPRRHPPAGTGPARGVPPGPQPHRVAGLGDRAADGRRADLPVPPVREPAHPVPGCGPSGRTSDAGSRRRRCSCCPP